MWSKHLTIKQLFSNVSLSDSISCAFGVCIKTARALNQLDKAEVLPTGIEGATLTMFVFDNINFPDHSNGIIKLTKTFQRYLTLVFANKSFCSQ